jgi:hypothetical protein
LKFRKITADIILIEVIQWLREMESLLTSIELLAYMAKQGYYLYGSIIGTRNFVFISNSLARDCFSKNTVIYTAATR